jgi:PAS domain S-box-containing protein
MTAAQTLLADLRDPRLAPHATAAAPAWLWKDDGSAILWANAAGAAMLGAPDVAAANALPFDPSQYPAAQIARLAPHLRQGGAPRLERLRGLGTAMGRPLLCSCTRLAERSAVLVVAAEPAGPALSPFERVRRLIDPVDRPLAAFADDGALIHANASAAPLVGGRTALAEFEGAKTERLGSGPSAVTLLALSDAQPVPGKAVEATPVLEPKPEPPAPAIVAAPPPAAPERTPLPAAPLAPPPIEPAAPAPQERRYPLRFVWQMDAQDRFSLSAGEFTDVIGPRIAVALGRPWREIADALGLDPKGDIATAIASRNTWSGIVVQWPVEGSDRRLPVELSGLPTYDRDRVFRGYRGFGVCRDVELIEAVMSDRTAPRRKDMPPPLQSVAPEPAGERSAPQTAPAENVVPFPASENKAAGLTPVERNAFSELATRLTARLKGADEIANRTPSESPALPTEVPPTLQAPVHGEPPTIPRHFPERTPLEADRPLLDRLPVALLVYRHDQFIYANPAFLDWSGYPTLTDFADAGGLDALFVEPPQDARSPDALRVATPKNGGPPLDARLLTVPWDFGTAMALVFMTQPAGRKDAAALPAAAETAAEEDRAAEDLASILDLMDEAVMLLDAHGVVAYTNRAADALFGYDLPGRTLTDLLAPESARLANEDLVNITRDQAAPPSRERSVVARRHAGGLVPLTIRIGRLKSGESCVVFRNVDQERDDAEELVAARKRAEDSSAAKSEFLAKVSHEIRTPLNAIIGFSEVMMRERFGPIGNDRYRQYLKDIHTSGEHVVELLSDIVDLSKIEAGKLELNPASVSLNDLAQQAVTMMQPQASTARVIVRVSLAPDLQNILADARSVRQILLNLLSNAIKFTGAGGQIIVSTAHGGKGGVVLRVRDTGSGMSEKDLEIALEPFRQVGSPDRLGPRGAGLGLPLTKALAEANRARFSIESAVNSGTLVEIEFPAARMVAE